MKKEETKKFVEKILKNGTTEDLVYEIIDYAEAFGLEDLEENLQKDMTDDEIIALYVETFSTDDEREAKKINQWHKDYLSGDIGW